MNYAVYLVDETIHATFCYHLWGNLFSLCIGTESSHYTMSIILHTYITPIYSTSEHDIQTRLRVVVFAHYFRYWRTCGEYIHNHDFCWLQRQSLFTEVLSSWCDDRCVKPLCVNMIHSFLISHATISDTILTKPTTFAQKTQAYFSWGDLQKSS